MNKFTGNAIVTMDLLQAALRGEITPTTVPATLARPKYSRFILLSFCLLLAIAAMWMLWSYLATPTPSSPIGQAIAVTSRVENPPQPIMNDLPLPKKGSNAGRDKQTAKANLMVRSEVSTRKRKAKNSKTNSQMRIVVHKQPSISLAAEDEDNQPVAQAESERWRQYLRHHPQDAKAYFSLANLLVRQGKRKAAGQSFIAALRHAPQLADYHFNHAVNLDHQGLNRQAAAHYRQALQLATRNKAHFNLADARRRLHEIHLALNLQPTRDTSAGNTKAGKRNLEHTLESYARHVP